MNCCNYSGYNSQRHIFPDLTSPLMAKLGWPALFCNELIIGEDGMIEGLLSEVKAHNSEKLVMQFETIAAGNSFNDLAMIEASKKLVSCSTQTPSS